MNDTSSEPAPAPSISIYQNPDHVAGILQQIFVAPLITTETRDEGTDTTQAEKSTQTGSASAAGAASIPLIGKIDANVTGQRGHDTDAGSTSTNRLSRNYEYSQAYYLYLVRNALRERGQLTKIETLSDAQPLRAGDFVEYEATFQANEISSLLDILTPDLIAAITYHHYRADGVKKYDAYAGDFEALQVFAQTTMDKAQMHADLARAVAEAVRVDFRSAKTREFYGMVGPASDPVTAITICDQAHFVVDDEDRILDGNFTVLGKVTSAVQADIPILERNKLLDRLKPEGVDQLFEQLRNRVGDQAQNVPGTTSQSDVMDNIVDTALSSRIEGSSFNVIPIAIFA